MNDNVVNRWKNMPVNTKLACISLFPELAVNDVNIDVQRESKIALGKFIREDKYHTSNTIKRAAIVYWDIVDNKKQWSELGEFERLIGCSLFEGEKSFFNSEHRELSYYHAYGFPKEALFHHYWMIQHEAMLYFQIVGGMDWMIRLIKLFDGKEKFNESLTQDKDPLISMLAKRFYNDKISY